MKKTDYAGVAKPGVVQLYGNYAMGLAMTANGYLYIVGATEGDITEKKTNAKPITPKNMDFAVKIGMTTNALEWTEEEKNSARALIGAVKQYIPERVEINRYYAYTQSAGQDKEQKMIPIDGYSVWNKFSVPTRNGNGTIYIPDSSIKDDGAIPTGQFAVNKNYVDGLVGDIESALDELHAYAQALINGGAAE